MPLTLEEIIKSQRNAEVKEILMELAKDLEEEKTARLQSFAELFLKIVESQEKAVENQVTTNEILKAILSKEYPEIPPYPEFPTEIKIKNPVSEVDLKKPDWWKDYPITDLSELKKHIVQKADETNQLLTVILAELQKRESKESPGIAAVIANKIGVRRSIGKLFKKEIPRGTIDGSNKVFYLSRTPFAGFLILELNGAGQSGGGVDYTIDGAEISYNTAPPSGSVHYAVFF